MTLAIVIKDRSGMFCLSNSRAIPRGRVRRNRLHKKRANPASTWQDTAEGGGETAKVHVTGKESGLGCGNQAMKIRRKSRLHLWDDLSISSAISWLSVSKTVSGYSISSHFNGCSNSGIIGRVKVNYGRKIGDSTTRDINTVCASNNVLSEGVILCSKPASLQCGIHTETKEGAVADDDIEDSYYYDNVGNLVTTGGARYTYNVGTKNRDTISFDSSSSSSIHNNSTNPSEMPAITHFVLEGSRLIKPVR